MDVTRSRLIGERRRGSGEQWLAVGENPPYLLDPENSRVSSSPGTCSAPSSWTISAW